MNTTTATKIGPGTTFHSSYADGNPKWEITRSRGRGVWEAKIVEDMDYPGVVKVFTAAEVKQAVGMSRFWNKNATDHEKFYAALKLGSVVHYHNAFGQFVRCEVVIGTTAQDPKPHRCLKPVALVGAWKPYDLPKRRIDGTIEYGYHAENIRKGECFEPNFSNLYESGNSSACRNGDPSKLPALDLSVPESSPEEQATAKLWQAVQAARKALEGGANGEDRDPISRLTKALEAIKTARPYGLTISV